MPHRYEVMKKAMVKEYGTKKGTEIAAKTFNKRNKGKAHVGKGSK